MTLSEFHTLVSSEMNKGTSLDSFIAARTRMAARWIERNYTLKYMERFVQFSASDRCIPSPVTRVKSWNFLRIVPEDDAEYEYLVQVDPQQVLASESANPTGFWLDGVDYLWFDNTPAEELDFETSYNEYTDWPTATTATPWLLANAEELMLARVMMMLAPLAREPGWLQAYKTMHDEGLRTLLLADEELRQSNRSERMIYEGRA